MFQNAKKVNFIIINHRDYGMNKKKLSKEYTFHKMVLGLSSLWKNTKSFYLKDVVDVIIRLIEIFEFQLFTRNMFVKKSVK